MLMLLRKMYTLRGYYSYLYRCSERGGDTEKPNVCTDTQRIRNYSIRYLRIDL